MPKSKAFIGIKRDICLIVPAIPVGRVTTFASIGSYMSVVPRHVAYILSTLTEEEQLTLPWHRVVGQDGKLGKVKLDSLGRPQESLLQDEGITVQRGIVTAFAEVFIEVSDLNTPVQPHTHYLTEGMGDRVEYEMGDGVNSH
ncbi:MGMT family protein [Oscillatoria sp. FACHB-1407]|uniref:MGMT family protein n=1 Tax=Oscillatoria sp. FACHB-1407 TaxID=2692847 RepID=UPI0016880653|nr:MGMT family protein [Oscillatoria sp. FACHB-1407]MBD2464881.1 MGMT family protein [Oscillatoria sp. FACHB-1407]